MARIQVQKQKTSSKSSVEAYKDSLAEFCYLYPRYTYQEALDLNKKILKRLLKAARREQARQYLELAQIARVAQAEKDAPYKSLTSRYEKEIKA